MKAYRILTIALLLAATIADAQEKAPDKKIYRWVDKNGKVQISDQLPPEAVTQSRKEYSADSGMLKKEVIPLNAAQQAAADKAALEKAAALERADQARRIEQGMLVNYETEEELQRFFDDRTDLLNQTIISLGASIQSRRAQLIRVLNEQSDAELSGVKASNDKSAWLKSNHQELNALNIQMKELQLHLKSLQGEFDAILKKYREMKADLDPEIGSTP
jgi:hypothetical protein